MCIVAFVGHLWKQYLIDVQAHHRVVNILGVLRIPKPNKTVFNLITVPYLTFASENPRFVFFQANTRRAFTLHLTSGTRGHLAPSILLHWLLSLVEIPREYLQRRELLNLFVSGVVLLVKCVEVPFVGGLSGIF